MVSLNSAGRSSLRRTSRSIVSLLQKKPVFSTSLPAQLLVYQSSCPSHLTTDIFDSFPSPGTCHKHQKPPTPYLIRPPKNFLHASSHPVAPWKHCPQMIPMAFYMTDLPVCTWLPPQCIDTQSRKNRNQSASKRKIRCSLMVPPPPRSHRHSDFSFWTPGIPLTHPPCSFSHTMGSPQAQSLWRRLFFPPHGEALLVHSPLPLLCNATLNMEN